MLLVCRGFYPLVAVPAQEGKPGNSPSKSTLASEASTSCHATDAIAARRSGQLTPKTIPGLIQHGRLCVVVSLSIRLLQIPILIDPYCIFHT